METEISFDIDDDTFVKISQVAATLEITVEQIIRGYLYELAGQSDGHKPRNKNLSAAVTR